MTWLRPAFAMLIAIFGSTADAGPQAVPRKYQAGFYLDGCKDFIAGRSNFLSGRCVGAIEVLSELGSDNKSFCAPETINNIEQVRARKGPVIVITSGNGADRLAKIADDIVTVPTVPDYLSPILTVIPLQLLAYHLGVTLGRDVDKPRNLAKSVTVE